MELKCKYSNYRTINLLLNKYSILFTFSSKEITVDQLAEYTWPVDRTDGESFMVQEQVCEWLAVKSFKRKYPHLRRRAVESEERAYLLERGLVSEYLCDLGLTAVPAADLLDIISNDFHDKYDEYKKHLRERQAKEITAKQKGKIYFLHI